MSDWKEKVVTAKVIQIDDYRPHWAIIVICEHCGHDWVAVFPEGTRWLECGDCGEFTRWHDKQGRLE